MTWGVQDLAALATVAAALIGCGAWLFRRVAIDPLKSSVDALREAISELKKQNHEDMEEVFGRLRTLERESTQHEERIETLFNRTDHLK